MATRTKSQKERIRADTEALQIRFGQIKLTIRAGLFLIVAATASFVSQLTISPVYGDIPSSLYHRNVSMGLFITVWVFKKQMRHVLPRNIIKLIPVVALFVPLAFREFSQFSTKLGPIFGPVLTEGFTFYPVLISSVFAAASLLELDSIVLGGLQAMFSWAFFSFSRNAISTLLQDHIGTHWILTRCGLWNVIGGIYALLSPSLLLLAAIPAIYTSTCTNTMCVLTPALNETLAPYNHSLIARQESNTGYVSILDNFEQGYRVMRCGHSLLGGEWQHAPKPFANSQKKEFKEPIYAVFVIMEAVRLIDPPPKNPSLKALTIGLGIGTSTDALIRHGIDVDIVELDPVVYKYAKDYFGLSQNHTAYIEDAVGFVNRESIKTVDRNKYDYILHDVFTGGAAPASLFTEEIFLGLKQLLAQDGVIAINWAGDLKLQAARSIIETVRLVFNNCRIFREDMITEEDLKNDVDFTNMVIFCTQSTNPYTFRAPTERDFLDSIARRRFLYPRHEINLESYWAKAGSDGEKQQLGFQILRKDNIHMLVDWQKTSAVGHWEVIRTVVPDRVWENY